MPEFERWIIGKPKNETGKIPGELLIDESKKRGYCVCPKPIRQLISFAGFKCKFCGQMETQRSYDFYYKEE